MAASAPAEKAEQKDVSSAVTNGHQSPQPGPDPVEPKALDGSPKRSIEEETRDQDDDNELPDAPPPATNGHSAGAHDGDEDANSEAETVLTSPVKRREAERRVATIKQEKSEQPKFSAQQSPGEVDDDEAALAWANDVEYGLSASVWTRDVERALDASRRLRWPIRSPLSTGDGCRR